VTVAVVFPWRGGQPERERHFEYVAEALHDMLPDAFHLDVDSAANPFSRAGSRNLGVAVAASLKADVVVLCDADTIPEPEPLFAAIEGAKDGRLHLPYTHFRGLSPAGTFEYLRGKPAAECHAELESDWSTGGVWVLAPDAFVRSGGFDERFVAWGNEDCAGRICCDAILGPTVKHEGTITHLWHPSAIDMTSDTWKANQALGKRYDDAEGDLDAVKALIAERGSA